MKKARFRHSLVRKQTAAAFTVAALTAHILMPALSAAEARSLLDPDGKPADMTKPVKVFIVMGQSNTLEMGNVKGEKDGSLEKAVKDEGLYPFLVDDAGAWTTRQDVRNVSVMMHKGGPRIYRNEWLTVEGKNKIGIEIGIGHELGTDLDEPVMVLKSSIGNRSLGWDLLPPGSERFTVDGATYAGYKDHPTAEILPRPGWKYPGKPVSWYGGKQYDDDVANAKKILENLGEYYPGAMEYEVAGFIWWQGDKDRYNEVHAGRYGKNLVTLIAALRKDFDATDAKFVCATLGQTDRDNAKGNEKLIMDGMFSLLENDALKGDVAVVYSHPLSKGSSSNAHYGGNAKTYMNVGLGLGQAMVELLKND